MSEFVVKAGAFEGPLDVLLDLIEKRKLHISDVSLASVTDEFVAHVQKLQEYSMGNVAQFILVASTLLLIKSRSLLPNLALTSEEESDIKNLEHRLELLKRMREASTHIKDAFGRKMIFAKSEQKNVDPIFSPDEAITKTGILAAMRSAIAAIPIKEIIPKVVVKKVVSLEEMIERLLVRVQSAMKMSFKDFTGAHKGEKVTIIVSFLAVLELVKQGTINVNQNEHFGDIEMETISVGVPRIL